MRKRFLFAIVFAIGLASPILWAQQKKALEVYFIDVEGGQSTLFVSPSGESLLVDTGWAGARDAGRIASVAKLAGVSQIDYLVLTHYHGDHAGGVVELASRIPINHFVDHGPSQEETRNVPQTYAAYLTVRKEGQHILAKPGDKIPVKGLDVQVMSANGDVIKTALKGGGAPNPLCGSEPRKPEDKTENARSTGTLITFGKFRLLDLGDLTWNKEQDLVCPNNLIGTVDVYLATHHASDLSGPATIVHAIKPRVAILDNGATKGASPSTWQTIHDSPGLLDMWQIDFAVANGKEKNAPEQFIANPDQASDKGNYLKLSAESNGTFTVTNSRNNFSKTYKR